MRIRNRLFLILALGGVSGCATSAEDISASEAELGGSSLSSLLACESSYLASITTYNYDGYERAVRITRGNYDSAGAEIEYSVSVETTSTSALALCLARKYTLSITTGLGSDAFEATVLSSGGSTLGSLSWTEGEVPELYDATGTLVSNSERGPFVITSSMAAAFTDMNVFTLLDSRVLGGLPRPTYKDGAAVTSTRFGLPLSVSLPYLVAVSSKQDLFSVFDFRVDLNDMAADAQTRVYDAINAYIYEPADYADHCGTEIAYIGDDHHHINHSGDGYQETSDDCTGSGTIGGFWNGHRIYLELAEAYLETLATDQRVPFRRIPSWDPADGVPSVFDDGTISNASGSTGLDMPGSIPDALPTATSDLDGDGDLDYEVCVNFAPAVADSYTDAFDAREDLKSEVNGWHGGVHIGVGGTFGVVSTAAFAPIFWPWHTTVDVVVRNWESCGHVRTTLPEETSW